MKHKTYQFPENFIDSIIQKDLAEKKYSKIITRFPPEPSGFLHIGHIKSIALNFRMAEKYDGECNLRFDDTNPQTSKQKYVHQIIKDLEWLGYTPKQTIYTSSYFDRFYEAAIDLIKKNKAYVCELSYEDIAKYRGSLTEPGIDSPYRNRSIEENMFMFENMKLGLYDNGTMTLRAKIDMYSPNMNMRDPFLYRIKKGLQHYHTGDTWCIYPSYDFSHALSDVFEKVSHSLCTLEFADHRPLYDWVVENCRMSHKPQQIEFSRLEISNTITSKRKIKALMEQYNIQDLSDPRFDTIAGLKARGYSPQGVINFCTQTGVSKHSDSRIERKELEKYQREFIEPLAPKRFVITQPLSLELDGVLMSSVLEKLEEVRVIEFSNEIFIEQEDFSLSPQPGERKLSPGGCVRLLWGPLIECTSYTQDESGKVIKVYSSVVSHAPKIDATLSWVDQKSAYPFELIEVKDINSDIKKYDAVAEQAVQKDKEWIQAYRLGFIKISDVHKLVVRLKRGFGSEQKEHN